MYRACQALGIEVAADELQQGEDPVAYIVSKNLHRRQLNESQRAMVAARIANLTHGGDRTFKQDPNSNVAPMTRAEAGKLLNIGKGAISDARLVLERGSPYEIEAVEKGDASVHGIAKNIKSRQPKSFRSSHRRAAKSNGNLDRIQRQRENAALFKQLKNGIYNLGTLPLASDVAAFVRSARQVDAVNTYLPKAIKWIKDFEDAWQQRS